VGERRTEIDKETEDKRHEENKRQRFRCNIGRKKEGSKETKKEAKRIGRAIAEAAARVRARD
jgi:hypothetical protein